MGIHALSESLAALNQQGFLSDLALHFGRFIARLDGGERPEVLLGACLASQWTGRGDVCLDLKSVAGRPLWDAPGSPLAPPLDAWTAALRQSPAVGRPGDYRPLVLDDAKRLYLYRYWNYEREVAAQLLSRAADIPQDIDLQRLSNGLKRLFPTTSGEQTDWQKVAAAAALLRRLCVISGGPGTGKTSTVIKILCLLHEQFAHHKPLRVALAAPTGKAAARLEDTVRAAKQDAGLNPLAQGGLPDAAVTIHRLLGARPDSIHYRYRQDNPLPLDVLVVDEASMVDLALMAKLFRALPSVARLVLLGDKDQLASVESGAVLGDICGGPLEFSAPFRAQLAEVTGEPLIACRADTKAAPLQDCIVLLQRNYRFGEESGIGQLARAVKLGQAKEAMELLRHGFPDLRWRSSSSASRPEEAFQEAIVKGFGDYLHNLRKVADPRDVFASFHRFRVLCAHRMGPSGVEAVNGWITGILEQAGLIAPRRTWYAGRPVMITRNQAALGLYNGDIGIAWSDPESGSELRVFFESAEGKMRKFSPARLPEHETAFAMTVHKSQGSEFEHVLFLMPEAISPVLTRELIYTAITRARSFLEIWGQEAIIARAIERPVERVSGLRDALWS